jgi:hypothetical protein
MLIHRTAGCLLLALAEGVVARNIIELNYPSIRSTQRYIDLTDYGS